ncbi:hypothetical protein [Pseudomonas sp. NPDC086278]|uniref:hypothetical protein n=1 Tax=Pseudomonas sp. NPDC086278 TaxID=3390646 RepID=UPI003D01E08E
MDVLLAESEGAREAISPGGCLTVIKVRAMTDKSHIKQSVVWFLRSLESLSAKNPGECAQEVAHHCATSCALRWKA